jgi:hypothetical protein
MPISLAPGIEVGSWTIIGPATSDNGRRWYCQCKCGAVRIIPAKTLNYGSSQRCYVCSRLKLHKLCGAVSVSYYTRVKHSAKVRGLSFSLTIKQLADLFQEQGGCCALTGTPLVFMPSSRKGNTTASLDHIDNKIGYEPGNVRWVHKVINNMRGSLTTEEFIEWCKKVTCTNPRTAQHPSASSTS